MRKEILRMERVTYKEQEVTILQDFSFYIMEGEIVGLIPENTYGLSVLFDILLYNMPLYDGYVYVQDKLVNSWRDMKRSDNRIALIQEKSSLVEGQNAVINIFVLRRGFKQEVLQTTLYSKQLRSMIEELGVAIPLDVPVERLSVFERILIELLRAVVANHRLIILHEISAILSDREREQLYEILRYFQKKGFTFLYISHWFQELLPVCQRMAIMKNGKIIKKISEKDINKDTLRLYTKEYPSYERRERKIPEDCVILEAKFWEGEYIAKFDFQVKRSECLVIQGIENKKFFELVRTLTGSDKTCESAYFYKNQITELDNDRRIALIQERPTQTMLFEDMSYMDNLCITLDHRIKGIWRSKKLRKSIQSEYGKLFGEEVFEKKLEELTQIQKYELVYGRILLQKPEVVFCIQPFKGVDMVHRNRIWELQEMLLKKGIAVVIVALNRLDEMCLADRILYL